MNKSSLLPCSACGGSGLTRTQPVFSESGLPRLCDSCYGEGDVSVIETLLAERKLAHAYISNCEAIMRQHDIPINNLIAVPLIQAAIRSDTALIAYRQLSHDTSTS